jgi:hypothetical protein
VKVKTPAPTPEDPAIVAARQREQARADGAFISNTQSLLDDETRRRQRQFGRRVALTGADPGGGIATGSGSSGDRRFRADRRRLRRRRWWRRALRHRPRPAVLAHGDPRDLQGRLSAARIDRAKRQDQINSYFDFADPAQPRVGVTEPTVDNALGVGELYDSTLMEVHEDFASDVIDRVMPRGRDWVEYQPDEALDESLAKQLAPEFQRRRTVIFSEIRKSNFYSEAAGEWAGHLAHGTGAMTINDFGAGQPLSFEAITPAQLLIERGPGGSLSLRGREFKWPIEDAIAYWPHYNWKAKHRNLAKSKETKRQRVMIVEAATLIPDPGMERWQWRVCVDDELVLDVEISRPRLLSDPGHPLADVLDVGLGRRARPEMLAGRHDAQPGAQADPEEPRQDRRPAHRL